MLLMAVCFPPIGSLPNCECLVFFLKGVCEAESLHARIGERGGGGGGGWMEPEGNRTTRRKNNTSRRTASPEKEGHKRGFWLRGKWSRERRRVRKYLKQSSGPAP